MTTYRCSDFVKLFLDLERPAVNEGTAWQHIICGQQAHGQTFYSKARALIFEFHSDSSRSPNDIGFIGEFRFLKQSMYKLMSTRTSDM